MATPGLVRGYTITKAYSALIDLNQETAASATIHRISNLRHAVSSRTGSPANSGKTRLQA
ncbi:hypothetical protein ACWJKU_10745 [Methylocaldum sp. MU1018]